MELNVHAAFANPVGPTREERSIRSKLKFEKNRTKIVISID